MRLEPLQYSEDIFCLRIGEFIIDDNKIDSFILGKQTSLVPAHGHKDSMSLVLQNLTIKQTYGKVVIYEQDIYHR